MKKFILPFLMSFIILIMTNTSYADITTKAKVNTTAVRIREEMSTDSGIKINLYEDDEVEVLEKNGEWYKIRYGEVTGYAKSEFFDITIEGDLVENTPETSESESQNTVPEEVSTNNEVAEETQPQAQDVSQNNISQTVDLGANITLANTVNLRILPSLTSTPKNEIEKGSNVTIESKIGKWCKISNQVISGWIIEDKINCVEEKTEPEQPKEPEEPKVDETPKTEEPKNEETETNSETTQNSEPQTNKTAIVIVETARVRSGPSATSDIIDTIDEDEVVTIIGSEGDFYKITSSKISSGYISKTLVREQGISSRASNKERENTVDEAVNENVNKALSETTEKVVTGNDIVNFAKQFLGYKYVLGASSPEKGFDCSGFTRYVFGNFGYKLGNVAANQTSLGTVVERNDLKTGDLLLFYNDGKTKIGHCGIYIGGGDFIHSANPERGVVIDNLNTSSYYSQRFVTARRIVNN